VTQGALGGGDIRQQLKEAIEHFAHVLPGQAPIQDFVHHNTLHGYQHLHFTKALAASHELTGAYGYLPLERFRTFYDQGRVTHQDLVQVVSEDDALGADETLFETDAGPVRRMDLYLVTLLHPLKPVTGCQMNWQVEELEALQRFQPDVSGEIREQLLERTGAGEADAIVDLWTATLEVLGLEHFLLHPEELLDLAPDQAEAMLSGLDREEEGGTASMVQRLMGQQASQQLQALLDRVGDDLTLRGVLRALTGEDLMDDMQPYVVRHISSWLDQGLTSWHHRDRNEGLYTAWKKSISRNVAWLLEGLEEWRHHIESLPDDPLDAVVEELWRLGLPRDRWVKYLERLALELPGWSGMFLWRHQHPGYKGHEQPVEMMDFLAVRLVMERVFALRLVARYWKIEPGIDMLRWYFRRNSAEFLVRYSLFNTRLPEYLIARAQRLAGGETGPAGEQDAAQWQHLARLIWTWQQSPAADRPGRYSAFREGWQLFRLAQHLGLGGKDLRRLEPAQVEEIFACLARLDPERAGYLRLKAFERHYREEMFSAVAQNHGQGRWRRRDSDRRPQAQMLLCMDDREEGLRRYLEEINPEVETLGAAGYFNLTINWRGLDFGEKSDALCPVSQTPVVEIREEPVEDQRALGELHRRRDRLRVSLRDLLHHATRRDLLVAAALIAVSAPGAAVAMVGKVFAPRRWGEWLEWLKDRWEPPVRTSIQVTAESGATPGSVAHPMPGFPEDEQLERVETFLRNSGLIRGFAPFVVMMGHGSNSQNNPHQAAYGCGACSGRYSGPNGRAFAAIVNRPEIRLRLAEQGIDIPHDTWFIGAEHNTCDDSVTWFDEDKIPVDKRAAFDVLKGQVAEASRLHARERCRRFASAPLGITPKQAFAHVADRMRDFSQARPELGHACIAGAFIGRRAVSRGLFFDRRVFLISYDPSDDPQGEILERVLLEVGPVGAGISLEYYFSSVNNEYYGCSSKVTHNVTGLFAVMEGAGSDLRTGLPKQMIEIHEPMRLQVMIEATPEVLTAIVERQPPLQELILNEWMLVSSVHPESGEIAVFIPEQGFVPWSGERHPLSTVERSGDWLGQSRDPLPPVRIRAANAGGEVT